MRLSRIFGCFLAIIALSTTLPGAWAEDGLQAVYADVLQGHYQAGQDALGRLEKAGGSLDQVEKLRGWLESYREIADSRQDLRTKTFEWNIDEAQKQLDAAKALAAGNEDPESLKSLRNKVYMALSFSAQATAYAEDDEAFAESALVKELRPLALTEAEKLTRAEKWAKAHMFYLLLNRINEDDEEVKNLRERTARHARLELIYETGEDVERRLKDVTEDLLYSSLKLIQDSYYTKPDFKKMAEGALDNLTAVCQTTQLYDGDEAASDFDGLADPVAREYFVGKLTAEKNAIEARTDYSHQDVRRLFNNLVEENKKSVSLPKNLLIVEFLEGALNELDNYTSIVWPADSAEFDKMMVGNFVGVGIQLGIDEVSGRLKVVTPLENSPALAAGIQPEDLIIDVDGETTKNWTTDKAVREITGPEGTEVTLSLYRPSIGKTITKTLKRSPIELTTIRGVERIDSETWSYILDKDAGIAYIQLTNFNPESSEELNNAVDQAKEQGMRGLILDLRNNPGGLLDVAVETVSEFVQKGDVVKTDGRSEQAHTIPVTGQVEYPDLPIVVLVNEFSASASEILAGCLRDHKRAVVLGERTFGKGSVQRVYSLTRSRGWFGQQKPQARLKLTTALYYLPNGESPHKLPDATKWGVDPHWSIELSPKEFSKVLEQQRKAFVIHNEEDIAEELDESQREEALTALKAEDEEEDEDDDLLTDADIELLRSDPYKAPAVDPQLQTALLQLRVKLAAGLEWPPLKEQQTAEATNP